MEQTTPEGSTQTTDPLPDSDDDPLSNELHHRLDKLFETEPPSENIFFEPENDSTLFTSDISKESFSTKHEKGGEQNFLDHHRFFRAWRG